MNITGAGSASSAPDIYLSALQATNGIAALSPTAGSSPATGVSGAPAGGADSVAISQPGQLLSELQALESKDPARFKQVLSTTASQLQALAQQVGQNAGGSALTQLANNFQTAANTGDLSALQPHGHHHHHHGGAPGAAGSTGAVDPSALASGLTNPAGAAAATPDVQSQLSSIFAQLSQALAQQ